MLRARTQKSLWSAQLPNAAITTSKQGVSPSAKDGAQPTTLMGTCLSLSLSVLDTTLLSHGELGGMPVIGFLGMAECRAASRGASRAALDRRVGACLHDEFVGVHCTWHFQSPGHAGATPFFIKRNIVCGVHAYDVTGLNCCYWVQLQVQSSYSPLPLLISDY